MQQSLKKHCACLIIDVLHVAVEALGKIFKDLRERCCF